MDVSLKNRHEARGVSGYWLLASASIFIWFCNVAMSFSNIKKPKNSSDFS
jgi:hypothetical protein